MARSAAAAAHSVAIAVARLSAEESGKRQEEVAKGGENARRERGKWRGVRCKRGRVGRGIRDGCESDAVGW